MGWPRDKIFIGSQENKTFLLQTTKKIGKIDIVIDDGGHQMEQQITSFEVLFPQLAEGGVYVIEDLHTSFWPEFGGGKTRTTLNLMKMLVDKLHWWAIRSPRAAEGQIKTTNLDYLEAYVSSVHFYDSICFIYKRKTSLPERVNI